MLWLALYLPHVGLEAAGCLDPQPRARVLAQRQGERLTVVDVDPVAEAAGIVRGMPVSGAYVLAPGLRVLERNPRAERRCLERLSWWALQFTPRVALFDQGLLLEVAGSLHLFGGWRAVANRVGQGMEALGHRPASAMAPTPLAAEWLARGGGGHCLTEDDLAAALSELPLTVLDLEPDLLSRLFGMGLRRVSQLLSLPREALGRRCGLGLGLLLDRALGRRADPRRMVVPPACFDIRLELPVEVDRVPALMFPLRRMVQELCGFLRGRNAAAREATLTLEQGGTAVQTLRLTLRGPSDDPAHWLALWKERLERLTLQAPVRSLGLRCADFSGRTGGMGDLFDEARTEDTQGWLDRLQARLGEDAVQGMALHADYRPEYAWRACRPGEGAVGVRPAPMPRRPFWLFAKPRALGVNGCGWPCWESEGALTLHAGPERIETGWWDDGGIERDYYLGISPAGRRLWIFRDRRSGRWYAQGQFT